MMMMMLMAMKNSNTQLHPQGEQDQLNAAITEDWAGWIGGSDQEMEVICFDISFSPYTAGGHLGLERWLQVGLLSLDGWIAP